jgi:hypothetical protein
VGCGVSVYHGIMGLMHPHQLDHLEWVSFRVTSLTPISSNATQAFGLIAFSGLIEGGSLAIAYCQVKQNAANFGFTVNIISCRDLFMSYYYCHNYR